MEHASELLHQICWALVQLLAGTEQCTPCWLPVEKRKPFLVFLLYPCSQCDLPLLPACLYSPRMQFSLDVAAFHISATTKELPSILALANNLQPSYSASSSSSV